MEGRHSREDRGRDSLAWTTLMAAPREEGWTKTKTSEPVKFPSMLHVRNGLWFVECDNSYAQ